MGVEDECVYCHSRYVNYMNCCLMCGRVQTKRKTAGTVLPQRGRRLTQEERDGLIRDVQCGLVSGMLNMAELGRKYSVDRKTVAYWKKKLSISVSVSVVCPFCHGEGSFIEYTESGSKRYRCNQCDRYFIE